MESAVGEPQISPRRANPVARRLRKGVVSLLWAIAGIGLVVIMWELVKLLGTWVSLPFDSSNETMPHVWTIFSGINDPEVRGSDTTVLQSVVSATINSLKLALGGFAIGVGVGLLLAVIMQRFAFLERGLLPFVIASQTVPLIALAPLIVGIGNKMSLGPFQWGVAQSVMFIAAYLAFFPMSVGALRGLKAPTATSLELMRSYAASPNQMLVKLRFPSSVPYLIPAMKVSAAAAVVGTVVAEISAGVRGGIGRLVIEYSREATAEPAKVFVATLGAIALGLLAAAFVTLLDVYLTRNLPKEGVA